MGWAKQTTAGTQAGERVGCCRFVPFKGEASRAKIGLGIGREHMLV